MWDFNGMKSDMRSFRKLEPSEGHPVLSLSFSPSGADVERTGIDVSGARLRGFVMQQVMPSWL